MDEDQALGRLREILARPEYRVDDAQPWWQQLFAPLLDLIRNLLAQFVQTVSDSTGGREGWLGLVTLMACCALFGLVVVYLVRAVRLSVGRENRVGGASLAERRERSERLWQTAQQLAAAGQLAEAVRVLYLSALYTLDERALLHVETSLTNREHARQLSRAHPEIGDSFGQIVERYDRLRYGQLTITRTTFDELNGLVARERAASLHGSTA